MPECLKSQAQKNGEMDEEYSLVHVFTFHIPSVWNSRRQEENFDCSSYLQKLILMNFYSFFVRWKRQMGVTHALCLSGSLQPAFTQIKWLFCCLSKQRLKFIWHIWHCLGLDEMHLLKPFMLSPLKKHFKIFFRKPNTVHSKLQLKRKDVLKFLLIFLALLHFVARRPQVKGI